MIETSFCITDIKRNSLSEETTLAKNFRRLKNSSLTSFARPRYAHPIRFATSHIRETLGETAEMKRR